MGTLYKTFETLDADYYRKKKSADKTAGKELSKQEFENGYYNEVKNGGGTMNGTGTSVFDPALCEVMYLWFSRHGDSIIDPFAGGSVRGIVAVELGRHYTGVDLRQEQIDANNENAEICTDEKPKWVCGDSLNIDSLALGNYDFLFTCPPYGNLEKYSDNPQDISNMADDDFDSAYCEILRKACGMLNDDRFAVVVVGNYRDKNGFLRDLVGLTVKAMESAGCRYYNDFIFITPCGSLPIRAGKSFASTRKFGRTHQYALTFIKGDPKKATERLGAVELPDMEQFCTDDE